MTSVDDDTLRDEVKKNQLTCAGFRGLDLIIAAECCVVKSFETAEAGARRKPSTRVEAQQQQQPITPSSERVFVMSSRKAYQSASKRLIHELQSYADESNPALLHLGPDNDNELMQWSAVMKGVAGSAYEGIATAERFSFLHA